MATVTINTGQAGLPPDAFLMFLGGSVAPVNFTGGGYLTQLDASPSSDPDGTIETYKFYRRTDGGNWILFVTKSTPYANHQIYSTSTVEYKVVVVDNDGLEDESGILTVNFTEEAVINCDAVINGKNFVTRYIQPLDATFVLDGTESDPGNESATITSYTWRITSAPAGSTARIANSIASRTSIGYLNVQGIYYVQLSIYSSNGTTDSLLVEIEVKDTDENGNYL